MEGGREKKRVGRRDECDVRREGARMNQEGWEEGSAGPMKGCREDKSEREGKGLERGLVWR